jgi:ribosomal protein S18 acetylase RimI-like enzyme
MTVRTRPATEADYAVAGTICYEAYRADGQLDGARGYGRVLADVAARAPVTEVIVADDPSTGELLGCVTFVLAGQPWAEIAREGEGEFRMLAVAPGAQGRGVGSALVRTCLERAVAQRCAAVSICTRDTNDRAIGMYERFGFVRIPERDWTPEPDVKLLAMRLELPRQASAVYSKAPGPTVGAQSKRP